MEPPILKAIALQRTSRRARNDKGGNDTIFGLDGNDTTFGGAGIDTLFGDEDNEYLDGVRA